MRRSCRSYMSLNVAQKDISRFNKPSNCAQKDPLWFNKLLISLHSGRRPPLYFFRMFVREERCLIISSQESPADTRQPGCSLRLPARDGGGVVPRPPRKRGATATAGRPKRGGSQGPRVPAASLAVRRGSKPWAVRAPGKCRPKVRVRCPLMVSTICRQRPCWRLAWVLVAPR